MSLLGEDSIAVTRATRFLWEPARPGEFAARMATAGANRFPGGRAPVANDAGQARHHRRCAQPEGTGASGLGKKTETLQATRTAVERLPTSRDAMVGVYNLERPTRVEAQTGQIAAAIEHLQHLLAWASGETVSLATLRIDPVWGPLRNDASFKDLLAATSRSAKVWP